MNKKKLSHLLSTAKFEKQEKISDIITKYKVKILYLGPNRNGSYFKKEVVDQMCEKMGGVPVIGYYSKESGDFTSHFGEYIQKVVNPETGVTEEQYLPTVPYGFIPANPDFSWEEVTDDDGVVRNYLTTEVYLWEGRYPELAVLHAGRPNNLSMELNPDTIEGDWEEVSINGIVSDYFCFTKADFIGICILGKDVEPCFEGAEFDPLFALEQKEDLSDTLKTMGAELKEALSFSLEKPTAEESEEKKGEEPKVTEEVTTTTAPIELEPEDISESSEKFVFSKDSPKENSEDEAEPTKEELEAIEAEKPEPEESDEELLASLDESDYAKKPEVEQAEKKETEIDTQYQLLSKENSEVKAQLSDLQVQFAKLTEDYKAATKELETIHSRAEKTAYLASEKDSLPAAAYSKFNKNIDEYSLDSLKEIVLKTGFEYLKAKMHENKLGEEAVKPAEEPSSEIIYDFSNNSEALDDAPEWVREVKKAQDKD